MFVDEVIVKFKGKVIFRQYIPKKHKRFGIKLYKLCDKFGYTFNMNIYLGKQRNNADTDITPTHGTVLELIHKIEGKGHKIFMDNYFTSPKLFNDLHNRKINGCGTVRYNRKGMPSDFNPKQLKLKKGDIMSRVNGSLRAVCWKDTRDVYILSNMHIPPVEGNFKADGKAVKPGVIIEDYNTHMGYVDLSDRMANSYNICRRTWKWTKKMFFHLLDLAILNAYILQKSCGSTLTHLKFREQLVRELIARSQEENLQVQEHSSHWPGKSKERRCRVCQMNKKTKKTVYFCKKCDCGLCIVPCFEIWHTKTKLRS
ncbi:PiggyBac transposable element-derived protein 4 [Blattella germanica]|nr:PiggyBac transposable element-derived protein 4 [Blattella germanica]